MSRKTDKDKVKTPSAVVRWWAELAADRRKRVLRTVVWLAAAAVVGTGAVLGMKALEARVLQTPAGGKACVLRVVLADRPDWVPATLAGRIVEALTPRKADYNDPNLTATVYRLAQANPWLREVSLVRKMRTDEPDVAQVEVHAAFRRAVAKIRVGNEYAFVDEEGVRLPAAETPQWVAAIPASAGRPARQICFLHQGDAAPGLDPKAIHYILIDGLSAPAPAVGRTWPGDDLAAGLRLVRLLATRSYVNQVTLVDVRNFGGRITRDEPHLRMYAQYGRGRPTDIRFGRFPVPEGGDYEVSPDRKLKYLDDYVADHEGWLAGLNSYIDLRFDQLHVSIN